MKLLLDTHTFIWFVMGSLKLSSNARALIEDAGNEKFISVASLWEMVIKFSLGMLTLNQSFEVFVSNQLQGFDLMNIRLEHLAVVSSLTFHHRDPFDRLLIAQSTFEQIPLLSNDSAFDSYPVQRVW